MKSCLAALLLLGALACKPTSVQSATTATDATHADDADELGNVPAASYALKTDTAPNSAQLGGLPASSYALATATAPNSAQLGGLPASSYALATATAPDSAELGGQSLAQLDQRYALLEDGGVTLAGDLAAQDIHAVASISGASISATTVSATGAISGASVSATGAISGASVSGVSITSTGAVNAASVSATGAISAASVSATGSVTAGDVTATGTLRGAAMQLPSVAAGTPCTTGGLIGWDSASRSVVVCDGSSFLLFGFNPPVLDQSATATASGHGLVDPGGQEGQSFTVGIAGALAGVQFNLCTTGPIGVPEFMSVTLYKNGALVGTMVSSVLTSSVPGCPSSFTPQLNGLGYFDVSSFDLVVKGGDVIIAELGLPTGECVGAPQGTCVGGSQRCETDSDCVGGIALPYSTYSGGSFYAGTTAYPSLSVGFASFVRP